MNLVTMYTQHWLEDISARLTERLTFLTIQSGRSTTTPIYTLGRADPRSYFRSREPIRGRLTFDKGAYSHNDFINEFVFNRPSVRMFRLAGDTFYFHDLEITYHNYDRSGNSPTWIADYVCRDVQVQRNSLTMEG